MPFNSSHLAFLKLKFFHLGDFFLEMFTFTETLIAKWSDLHISFSSLTLMSEIISGALVSKISSILSYMGRFIYQLIKTLFKFKSPIKIILLYFLFLPGFLGSYRQPYDFQPPKKLKFSFIFY